MKKETLLSLSMLFCATCFAQNITVTDSKIGERDDKVSVTFSVGADRVKSDERLTITPVLFNGTNSVNLPSVILIGRNRAIADQRNNVVPQGIRIKENQHIPYSASVPYESWMNEVSLAVESKVESCCAERQLASQTVVANKLIRAEVVLPEIEPVIPTLSPLEKLDNEMLFLAPMNEYETYKNNFEALRAEGALIVSFRQGNMLIDPNFGDNANSLEQIRKVFKLIDQDPNASLGRILLAGTASPEGASKLNEQLAQKRAEALQNYLKDKIHANMSRVESITIGEDWVGLYRMVEASDMQYKREVLDIIDNVPVEQGREKKLMDLESGRPYRYLQDHFFPKLRSAGYIRIFYDSKPSDEAKESNEAAGTLEQLKKLKAVERSQ